MATLSIEAWYPTEHEEQAFRANDETLQWLLDLPLDAVQQFAGKWIAARDRQIVAFADSLDALLKELDVGDLQSVIIDRIERAGLDGLLMIFSKPWRTLAGPDDREKRLPVLDIFLRSAAGPFLREVLSSIRGRT